MVIASSRIVTFTRRRWRKIGWEIGSRVLFYGGLLFLGWWWMLRMPGCSYHGPLRPLSASEISIASRLSADVHHLAGSIGQRNVTAPRSLDAAADYISDSFRAGGYRVRSQVYDVDGVACRNVEAELPGAAQSDGIIIIGAHYDTVWGTPGADDNASGVAVMLAIARMFAGSPQHRTLRFVAFANEEPPYFWQPQMGSLVYARQCRSRHERVAAMISLESVGFYSDDANSQRYPAGLRLFFPSLGNFVAFAGNLRSASLVREALGAFRATRSMPSLGAALPNSIPGVGWSDQWSFWQEGYKAIEITDTAPYRNPFYHTAGDTPDRLDYGRMARLTTAMTAVVKELAESRGRRVE